MILAMPAEDWEVRKRDECTCQYCGLRGLDNFDIWMNLTIDHLIPSCSGGDDTAENKVVACGECNTLKGTYVPVGNEREERIADARRYVQKKREDWRHLFETMMIESGALTSPFPN